jgi:hypothetical protein
MSSSPRSTPSPLPAIGRAVVRPPVRNRSTSRAPSSTKLPSVSQRSSAAASAGSSAGSADSLTPARSSRSASSSGAGAQPSGVLLDGPDVGQHGAQPGDQVAGRLLVQRPVEEDGHPGLGQRVVAAGTGLGAVAERADAAGHVAADHEHRVDDVLEAEALPHHLGGDRVDEEGHVVGDDQHQGARSGAAAGGQLLDVHRGRPLGAHLGQPQVPQRERGEVGRVLVEDLGGRLAPVVAAQQRRDVVGAAPRGAAPRRGPGPPGRRAPAGGASRRGPPRGRRVRSRRRVCVVRGGRYRDRRDRAGGAGHAS